MKRAEIAEVLDRVREWPADQQERVAEILIALENADADCDWALGDTPAVGK